MRRITRPTRLASMLSALSLLISCGGGGDESATASGAGKGQRARALSVPAGTFIPTDANVKGAFGVVQPMPVIPVHAVMTADGRVLSYGTDTTGRQTASFNYSVWDPVANSHTTFANGTGTDIFCSSQLLLPSGDKVFIAGGDNWTGTGTTNSGNNNANLFTLAGNTLARQTNNMNRARWYSTSTMLLNGEILTQGGSSGTDRPEVRQADGSFRLLTGADTSTLDFMYPRNFIAPDGRVFGFDSAGRMYWLNPTGAGTITMAGQFSGATGSDSSAAMFAPGRILQFGGNLNGALVIDINSGTPSVTATASMAMQRRLGTATLLPDGKVLATGGSSVWNAMTNVVYDAEIWNPASGQWTRGATAQQARLYHSVAMLLPDATVMVAGGGAPGPQNNLNMEIYYPPYLFGPSGTERARPLIASAPTVVDPGRTVQVNYSHSRPVAQVTMVKTGSVTHGWNMDQRFVDLPFNTDGGQLNVQVPARASDVPPGMWMVFVIDDLGVPSEAKMVRVNVAPTLNTSVVPSVTSPGNQNGSTASAVDLQIAALDPNGDALRYSASGLPPGLMIDPSTGRIIGTPTSVGSFSVSVAASDGYNSASTNFAWTVTGSGQALQLSVPTAPAPALGGATAGFSASAVGTNVQFSWNFGDGSEPTAWSTSGSAAHVYSSPGIYFATVTARDGSGTQQSQIVMQQVYLAGTAQAPSVSANIVLEPRAGLPARVWVVNQDNDSVSVFDTQTRVRVAEIAVGGAPRALAIAPDGRVWVSNKAAASISVIDPASLAVTRTIALPRASQPFGIAMARANNTALVALEATGQLLRIDVATYAATGTLAVGANARHVAVAADGSTALVSRFITPPLAGEGSASVNTASGGGQVVVVDSAAMAAVRTVVLAHSDQPDAENQGRGVPNYLGAAAISPDGTQAFVPSKMDNVLRGMKRDGLSLNFQNTVRAISSRIDLVTQTEDLGARFDHDNASMASAAAFDPLGVYLFVALETSREVAVLDAHRRNQIMRIDVGRAPQGLVVSPDRKTLYVHNFMDRSLGVYDLRPLTEQATASAPLLATLGAVGTERLAANVLLGKQHFYDARDTRLARDRYMSCASCHNDGGHDGRVWDLTAQGEGLRNTISLRGRANAQGRLHWSNNFDELQDFEGQIRALAGGTGLMSDAQFTTGTRSQPLGDPKAGVSADLDALAAYVGSLKAFDPSPHRAPDGSLTSAAADGRNVFIEKNCASCHSGSAFTRSAVDNPTDVGTLKGTSGSRLFGALTGIDVPTLRDVWATAPYLHDGSAATLEAAVRAHSNVAITDADLTRVVAYVREIGSEESSALFASGGLTARYYNNTTMSGAAVITRNEAVDFNWSKGSPGSGVNSNNFSARWVGRVVMPSAGSYRFQTESDDGVRLWIDGQLVINNWTAHSRQTNTSTAFTYLAGQQVDVVMEYYDGSGNAVARLRWLTPGATGYVAIPATRLMPAPVGLQAQYFNTMDLNGAPVLTRQEAVDYDWTTGSPAGAVNADQFSARWTGSLIVTATGNYQLRTVSDDGVRLTVGGVQRINNWTDHAPTTDTTVILALTAGQRVPITLEYYENGGGAVMRLQWVTPGSTTYVAVPATQLTTR